MFGGDIILGVIFGLFKLIYKKLHKKKQPSIRAVNSEITIIIINKD